MKITDIKLNPNNPRQINETKFKKLKQSIQEFPKMLELRPIVVDKEGIILGGNMRYRALQELGMEIKDEWVKVADKLTDEERRRFIVEDNLDFGEFDWDSLSTQYDVEELMAWGMDEKDLQIEKEVVEDEAPEVSDEPPVSKLGEVYQLGRHRLMCGDSTKINDVEKLMDGKKADMVFADPPYNVGLKYEEYQDDKSSEEYKQLISDYVGNGLAIAPTLVITPGKSNEHYYYKMFDIKDSMTWYKKFGTSRGSLYKAMVTEPILFIGEKPLNKNFATDILEFMTDRVEGLVHACPKPIKLIAEIITTLTDNGKTILDLFLGSGSTLIACEQTNRICYGMELDNKYIDVIIRRWQNFTGQEAVREDGVKWNDLNENKKQNITENIT